MAANDVATMVVVLMAKMVDVHNENNNPVDMVVQRFPCVMVAMVAMIPLF